MASIHRLPVKTQDESDSATLSVQLLRAKYAVEVAEALYRAHKMSPHARLGEASPESRSQCLQIAEAAVMLAVDSELREAAELYVADAMHGPLGELKPGQRLNKAKDVAEGIRLYLRFLRGWYPVAIQQYRNQVRSDKAALVAARAGKDGL